MYVLASVCCLRTSRRATSKLYDKSETTVRLSTDREQTESLKSVFPLLFSSWVVGVVVVTGDVF
jgi:hypothetical protein